MGIARHSFLLSLAVFMLFLGSTPATAQVCVGPLAEGDTLSLSCPSSGALISSVQFASYGTPTGNCGAYVKGSCDASTSVSVFESYCLNKHSCSFEVSNTPFDDPCVGVDKVFVAQVTCSTPTTTTHATTATTATTAAATTTHATTAAATTTHATTAATSAATTTHATTAATTAAATTTHATTAATTATTTHATTAVTTAAATTTHATTATATTTTTTTTGSGTVTGTVNTNNAVYTWIANTYAGDSWVNYNVSGFYVLPDGTTLTNTAWDEGGREVGIYKNGKVVGLVENTHGWGRTGGDAVTSDGTYIYFGTTQDDDGGYSGGWPPQQWPFPPLGSTYYMVRRANMDGTTAFYGQGSANIGTSTDPAKAITGLAITSGILYVSRSSVIELYNASTGALKSSWPATGAGHLALDSHNNLWVSPIARGNICMYKPSGQLVTTSVIARGGFGITIHRKTNQLLVAGAVVNGVLAPNITVYNTNANGLTSLAGTFGKNVFAYNGVYGDDRMENVYHVGSDSTGNIYVAMCLLGTSIRVYSATSPTAATSTLLWKVQSYEWLSTAHYNPVDDRIYGPNHVYNFAHNKIGNGTEWSLYSSTLDILSYPWDPRGNWSVSPGSTRIHYFGGQKFMSLTDMYVGGLLVYRFVGEIAILCAALTKGPDVYFLPNTPVLQWYQRYLWTDVNGNSYPDANEFQVLTAINEVAWSINIDANGTIWQTNREDGIEAFYAMGLSSHGVPLYSYSANSYKLWPNPASMTDCLRSYYDSASDTMYLSGSTTANPFDANHFWGGVGKGFQKYTHWTTSAASPKTPAFEFTLPDTVSENGGPAYRAGDVLDNLFFAVDGYFGNVDIYNANNGQKLGSMTPIFPTGWIDMPFGMTVGKRSTGEYVVIVEEDLYDKNTAYVVPPS